MKSPAPILIYPCSPFTYIAGLQLHTVVQRVSSTRINTFVSSRLVLQEYIAMERWPVQEMNVYRFGSRRVTPYDSAHASSSMSRRGPHPPSERACCRQTQGWPSFFVSSLYIPILYTYTYSYVHAYILPMFLYTHRQPFQLQTQS